MSNVRAQEFTLSTSNEPWEKRLASAWLSLNEESSAEFVAQMQSLVAELPPGDAVGLFELACAQDSTGHSEQAVPLYQAALATGLIGLRRRRAAIQLASSLRNLGKPEESLALLTAEATAPEDELSGAVSAFLALALVSVGREREAVAASLQALSRYLPRYNVSLARYARELVEPSP